MMNNNCIHLLAVDDDPDILALMQRHFEFRGYDVSAVNEGQRALEIIKDGGVDVAVLDINLPDIDGLSLCRYLRECGDAAIILATGNAEETDRIVGLELGADDYVCKPFSVRELEARVKAILRRGKSQGESGVQESNGSRELQRFESWALDLGRRELRDQNDQAVSLTGSEYRLLKAFTDNPNRVLSRDQLMNMTRGHDAMPFDRSIDVQVGRLRKKLGDNGKNPQLIKTFRGEGYVLTAKVQREVAQGA